MTQWLIQIEFKVRKYEALKTRYTYIYICLHRLALIGPQYTSSKRLISRRDTSHNCRACHCPRGPRCHAKIHQSTTQSGPAQHSACLSLSREQDSTRAN